MDEFRTRQLADPTRLAQLHQSGLLDSPPEPAFDRWTRLAATMLTAPIALLVLVDVDRQFFKSTYGLGEPLATTRQTSLLYSYCQHQVLTGQPLVISDARIDARVRDSLALTELGLLAYAGIPLITAAGSVLGSFCVIDTEPRDWRQAEVALLTDLVAAVMTEIDLRRELGERRRLEHEREEALRAAQRALVARDDFLSIAAHELKTPLSALVGALRLLEQSGVPPIDDGERWQRHLAVSTAASQRLHRLIDGMVELSYIQAGSVSIRRQPVNLYQLVERAVSEVQLLARREVNLICSDESLVVNGDARRLELVLDNLLQNALKYSPRGRSITIRVERHADEAWVAVEDQGIGIPQAEQARLFERYYRATNVDHSIVAGTGIGLYIVQEIVRHHGGSVTVVSQEGVGSTFTIRLPLQGY